MSGSNPLDEDLPEPTVERLAVEETPTKPRPRRPTIHRLFEAEQPQEAPAALSPVVPPPAPHVDRSVVAFEVFQALGRVLAARALIFVFGVCGFAIAFVAALRESREVLFVFVAWTVLTVIPLIVLDVVTRRRE